MGFKCGIIGLPNVGKSTLFNALTQSNKAEAANYPFATIDPNIGRIPVPDKRLNNLSLISNSDKTIPTFIDFVDIAGLVKGASKGEGLGNKFLANIREVDAIVHVIRCFEDVNITHISNNIDPISDIETVNTELQIADIETVNNKIKNLEKKTKSGDKVLKIQLNFLNKLLLILNDNNKIDKSILNNNELEILSELNLFVNKPLMFICNVSEKDIHKGNKYSDAVFKYAKENFNISLIVSAAIEAQLADFSSLEEKKLMLYELGLDNTSLNKVINSGYNLLNLITFFTSGKKESRAWTIKTNSKVTKAAGKIHTDFEKGFIRAEAMKYDDFIKYKGELGCREEGKLRQEGREYVVQDGDIFHFLFNI